MKIGLNLPQGSLPAADLAAFATGAERHGYASLWGFDRLLAPVAPRTPYPASADGVLPSFMSTVLDPMLALTVAASATSTIGLGTSVLVAPWYPPLLLARAAASLDRLSDGRFTLGLGVGWSVDEYEAVGVPMAGRGRRLEEVLDVMDAAWAGDVVTVTTSRETVAPSVIGLKPVRGRVPLVLAAYTPDGLDRVARRADGWNPAGVPVEAAVGMWHGALATAERAGRDPGSLRLVVRANVHLAGELPAGRPDFVGSLAQVRDDVQRCADLGVDDLIVDLAAVARTPDEAFELAATVTAGVLSPV